MNTRLFDDETKTLLWDPDDATSVMLMLVIAHLVLAILMVGVPESTQLTPEQISRLPLWGP